MKTKLVFRTNDSRPGPTCMWSVMTMLWRCTASDSMSSIARPNPEVVLLFFFVFCCPFFLKYIHKVFIRFHWGMWALRYITALERSDRPEVRFYYHGATDSGKSYTAWQWLCDAPCYIHFPTRGVGLMENRVRPTVFSRNSGVTLIFPCPTLWFSRIVTRRASKWRGLSPCSPRPRSLSSVPSGALVLGLCRSGGLRSACSSDFSHCWLRCPSRRTCCASSCFRRWCGWWPWCCWRRCFNEADQKNEFL